MVKTYGFSVEAFNGNTVEIEIHAKSYYEAWDTYISMGIACMNVTANPTAKEDGGWD